jgi:pimeloyl-ACP methyl ester carboxylesterase
MLIIKLNDMKKIEISKFGYCFLVFVYVIFSTNTFSQDKTINFITSDKVIVTADIYATNPANSPFIILFHQANYSRGEYVEIAPKLNTLGFNCMAVDLRSGDGINGVENKTWKFADSLKMETRYTDAYNDMRASVSYVKKNYPGTKIILFGSSYSASLAIKLASEYPQGISGVVAFSPGEYFAKFGWNREIIKISAAKLTCPVFISSANNEQDSWKAIFDAIPGQSKVSFLPQSGGIHGAKTLWSTFPESQEYWKALTTFLKRF